MAFQDDILIPTDRLHWFRYDYMSDIAALRELFRTLQDGIAHATERLKQQATQAWRELHEKDREQYLECVSDQHWGLSEEYPLLMRRAMLMVVYAKTEHSVSRLCKLAHLDRKARKRHPSDVRLSCSKAYIKQHLGIQEPSFVLELLQAAQQLPAVE